MSSNNGPEVGVQPVDCLSGGGEMGALMRAVDWDATPVGPVSTWPQSLRTALGILLSSVYPMYIAWGPEYTQFYNDAYRPILGSTKHPALGLGTRETFAEIWDFIGPMFDQVMSTGEATWKADQLLPMDRHGYREECYFTFSYSAVRNEANLPGGVFVTVIETTERVLGERRMRTLRELAAAGSAAATAADAAVASAATLSANPFDLPFALIYLADDERSAAQLCGAAGIPPGTAASPVSLPLSGVVDDLPWPLARLAEGGKPLEVRGLTQQFPGLLSASPWEEPVEAALVLPLPQPGEDRPAGFLVTGVSPRRSLDDEYRGFLDLVAQHVANSIANARAREAERRRAESLAELDRAKTTFFSNVSHEFRTPLTLMLGPLEEVLSAAELPDATREQLTVVQRNGMRLLKLVNTLLDFSRIEAGRVEASYESTDLCALTTDLASAFRSAVERAGMRLRVECPTPGIMAYVDRNMWEKIVLNLLSNAFKFTHDGEIAISLRQLESHVELTVSDTGVGIPAEELPRLFERFHRVPGTRGRSQEGSGIGLALVQELVRLHGGEIRAESELGRGSRFVVAVPLGREHLPADRVEAAGSLQSTAMGADPYVEEALGWLPGGLTGAAGAEGMSLVLPSVNRAGPAGAAKRVLLADDNSDMREYITRLLAGRYSVEAVGDGLAALNAARQHPPDLVITDVMMPGLDGFELLHALREQTDTRLIPVLMLSARAGEEARVEGLKAGADDYLVKPFSSRELLARVDSLLAIAELRADTARRESELADAHRLAVAASEERYRSLVQATAAIVWTTAATGEFASEQPGWTAFTGQTFEQSRGTGSLEAIHPDDWEYTLRAWESGIASAAPFQLEHRVRRADGEYRHMVARVVPIRGGDGTVREWVGAHTDVTAQRELEKQLEAERRRLQEVFTAAPAFLCTLSGPEHVFELANPAYYQLLGREGILGEPVREAIPELAGQGYLELLDRVYQTGVPFVGKEMRIRLRRRADGELEDAYLNFIYLPLRDPEGAITGIFVHGVDITEQVLARQRIEALAAENEQLYREARHAQVVLQQRAEQLAEADRRKDEFLATLAHELRNPLAPIRNGLHLMRQARNDPDTVERARAMMDRQVQQMVRLIDDLLDLSRISRGTIELRKESVDLATVLRNAVETSRPLLEQSRHTLVQRLPEKPVLVNGDVTRLTQVFGNLLNNAAKYTEPGGRIELEVTCEEGAVQVRVRDNGVGIAPEMLCQVFQMFSQVDRTLERSRGGLGIGLSIVKQLVEMHGGTVEAHSEGLGRGSEFLVRLPTLAPFAAGAPQTADGSAAARTTRKRLLVADDNQDAAASLGMLLELQGNEVRIVHDGQAAVEAAAEFRPHVILLDIGMPRLNGYDACRQIREQAWNSEVILIALTGWGQEEDRRRSLEAGFDYHLVKPVEPAELEKLLAALPTAP